MSLKRPILRLVSVTIVALVALCAVVLYRAWSEYAIEGEIQATFFPLAKALERYETDYRSPARISHNLCHITFRRFQVPAWLSQLNTLSWTTAKHGRSASSVALSGSHDFTCTDPPRCSLQRKSDEFWSGALTTCWLCERAMKTRNHGCALANRRPVGQPESLSDSCRWSLNVVAIGRERMFHFRWQRSVSSPAALGRKSRAVRKDGGSHPRSSYSDTRRRP